MVKKEPFLGERGEKLAADFLEDRGYKIISRRYRVRFGEIDIIALDRDIVCFIEVKSRRSFRFGLAAEAISYFKQRKISKVALNFLKENCFLERKARFDVVSVDFSFPQPRLALIKNAFELCRGFDY